MREGGDFSAPDGVARSARRWRLAHAPATRRLPWKPSTRSRRQNSAPFRQPPAHFCSNRGSQGCRLLARMRKISSLPPLQNLPNALAVEPCLANDPPDRHAIISHLANHLVGLLAAQIAFVLQLFNGRQQLWIQCLCSDRFADGRRVTLYGGQESRARVFQQLPAVGNLNRFWQSP